MQQALGVMGDQAIMIGITFAMGVAGILGLFMALFWPRRWRLHYRMEIAFVVILIGLAVYAERNSTQTFQAYEAGLEAGQDVSGKMAMGQVAEEETAAAFDQRVTVYAFQWGFLFFDENGAVSRNAVRVAPGSKVLFAIAANDVIHGFNIPVARVTTELEPGRVQSVWIRAPEKPGKYLIQCLNYCGVGHSQMKAWMVVGDENQASKEPPSSESPKG
jgi:cytochrome c oxidase subunit II